MGRRVGKKFVSAVLCTSMIISTVPPFPAVAATSGWDTGDNVVVDDMVVAKSVYGWALENAEENADSTVSIKIMPAGKTKAVEYTTAIQYGVSNAMTGASQAGNIVNRCKKGTFVEICLNEDDEVIDIRRVLQSGLNFDTAKFGGDLTAIGSRITNRGADYEDIYRGGDTGRTGALTGTSGRMVAMGWLLEKDGDSQEITVGDGNRTTDVFHETYKVSDDVKVYRIANDDNFSATKISFNGETVEPDESDDAEAATPGDADKATPDDAQEATPGNAEKSETDSSDKTDDSEKSTPSNADKATSSNASEDSDDDEYGAEGQELIWDLTLTAQTSEQEEGGSGTAPVDQDRELTVSRLDEDGYIYDTPSDERIQVIVIFDKDYEEYDDAMVTEIYEYEKQDDISKYVGLRPEIVRITSDLSTDKQGRPSPTSAPYLIAAKPITVVEDKMWTIGDIEDNCPIFKGGNDDHGGDLLVQFDTGWPRNSYQYMSNIEKTGNDPRDLDMILVPHGHGDHYGALYDEWEMVVRQRDNEDNSISPIVYESYEDTIGFDIHGFPEIGGIYNDQSVRSIITNWYPNDEWNSLGDGLSMMVTLTPGHSQGCGSAVFDVEVQETMEDAKLTYEYDPDNAAADSEGYVRTYSDYEPGDHIMFAYMGGYGINGLDSASTAGFRRTAFVSSLRYIESVFSNMDVPGQEGTKADGVYNLAQHTNQYPYTETAEVMDQYNEMYGTDYPFLHFMREGREEIINFCEKRASAMLYSDYTANYMEDYEANGGSPFYDYDGIQIKTDITSTKLKNNTVEDAGPYKHEGGRTEIEIVDDVDILVMHGYDVFLNKGVVPEEAGIMTRSQSTNLADRNWNVVKGFAFAKDGYVYDPDKWYVQIAAHVNDDYDGNVYSNEGANAGITLMSGPVDSLRGDGWYEVIRTGAMTKEEAEALAASLKPGGKYIVNLKKTGDIINDENDIMNTFTAADDHKGDDNGDNSGNDNGDNSGDDNNDDKTPGGDSNNGQHSGGSSGSSGRGSSSVSTSTSGSWTTDVNGWKYRKPDGSYVKSGWEQILWNQQYNWYHFDENGYCQGGWFTDTDGMIYYLYNVHDGEFGRMYTGWNVIDGKYYYFEPAAGNKQGHLYRNTTTPDGYQVADDGTWIQ